MTRIESTGDRLARYRKAAGVSAQKLADEIGTTRAVINNIESGRREDMTVGQLVQIASALGIPSAALAANIYDPFGPSGYGDLSNWDVVRLLSREGPGADLIWTIEMLMDVKGDWGRQANDFLDRARAAQESGDERDIALARLTRERLVRLLERGKEEYARLETAGVDVSWARGDWMTYEVPELQHDSPGRSTRG